jgi:hypothetical protein
MNKVIGFSFLGTVLIISASNAFSYPHNQAEHEQPRSSNNQKSSVFPSYQQRTRNTAPAYHDSLGNRVTQDHVNRVNFANTRSENVMRNDVHVTESVRYGRSHFVNNYRPVYEQRNLVINGYVNHYNQIVLRYPQYIGLWHQHYFYGGFYYGFHPLINIDAYFYNPMVYWFYMPNYNTQYYSTWYNGSQYEAYPTLHYPFSYHGLYYPTDNLKQLLFGVSAMTLDRQVQFRAAITLFTKDLAQQLANTLNQHIKMSNGDIVVTHYEILGNDESIELEGFISFNGVEYNFKGLLDLQDPRRTSVFVPKSLEATPDAQSVKTLDQMNGQIDIIKNDSTSSAVEPEIPATPAEVNADPQVH